MYDLSTERGSRKENAGLGPDPKGIKKKRLTTEINHWYGRSHKTMMLNRNAKENAGDNSFGRPPRTIHTARDYGHKV